LPFDVVLVEGMLAAADGTISQRHPLSGWWALLMMLTGGLGLRISARGCFRPGHFKLLSM
jgi:hypothetical protein